MESAGLNASQCRSCHGTGYNGTVLSRIQSDGRSFSTDFGTRTYWRGQMVSCYDCHNGSGSESATTRSQPQVSNVSASTTTGNSVGLTLAATNPNGSTPVLRIVSQPANGTVAISGNSATYFPGQGFAGTDMFTYAASDIYRDSNLATGTVIVTTQYALGDGIPDWWRQLNFGCIVCPQATADADPDHDGMSNYQEFVAGTDPNDVRSNLRIFGFGLTAGNAVLDFVSLLGNRYAVDYRDDLLTGSWIALNSNVWGKTDTTSLTDTNAVALAKRFYRVRVVQ